MSVNVGGVWVHLTIIRTMGRNRGKGEGEGEGKGGKVPLKVGLLQSTIMGTNTQVVYNVSLKDLEEHTECK